MSPVGVARMPMASDVIRIQRRSTRTHLHEVPKVDMFEMRQRGDARAVSVPHHPVSVPAVRRMMAASLSKELDADLVHEAGVIASELLANAVRHARPRDDGRMVIRWQVRAGVLDLEVTDGGSCGEVRPRRPSVLANGGRGLRIVRHLAHEWGVFQRPDGRTVWACLGGPSRRRHRA